MEFRYVDAAPLLDGAHAPAEVADQVARIGDPDPRHRSAAVRALAAIGAAAVLPLCGALNDDRVWARFSAAEALGQIRDARAGEPLCAALRDADSGVRSAAAEALGQIGNAMAVGPLCAVLWDEDGSVRRSAAVALAQIREAAILPLCNALSDRDERVRSYAAKALGRMGEPAVLPVRVLACVTMTAAEKLDTLQAMSKARPKPNGQLVRYGVGNVTSYCESVCRLGSPIRGAVAGAEAVLEALRSRASGKELLRASQPDDGRARQELLRGAAGAPDTTPSEELLRGSGESS